MYWAPACGLAHVQDMRRYRVFDEEASESESENEIETGVQMSDGESSSASEPAASATVSLASICLQI